MNLRRILALARKDWLELLRNRQALLPIVMIPLLLVVLIPVIVVSLSRDRAVLAGVQRFTPLLEAVPEGLLPQGGPAQLLVYGLTVYFFAPFFLLIPVMIATVTASSSFVGEKERRTIEGLLYTPLTDRELVVGKLLVSLIPSVLLTWLGFLVYAALVNSLAWPIFERLFFPTPAWIVSMLLLVPLVAFLAICVIIAISQRALTVQSAQVSAAFLILPVAALIVSQATGLMLFEATASLLTAAVLLLADAAVLLLVVRRFGRERILTRL